MKKCFLLVLVALGLVAFVPQKSKADGYFNISVGPAYCDPHPVYYGGYYPQYYHHYYYDSRYEYWRGRHHRHWHHWHDND